MLYFPHSFMNVLLWWYVRRFVSTTKNMTVILVQRQPNVCRCNLAANHNPTQAFVQYVWHNLVELSLRGSIYKHFYCKRISLCPSDSQHGWETQFYQMRI